MLRSRRILSAALRNVNGGGSLNREEKIFPVVPLRNPYKRTCARFKDVHEMAAKSAVTSSNDSVDEIRSGYYLARDMKGLKKHGGKISKANKSIVPAKSALKFPMLEVYL